ncbi:MAG: hypothetical protein OEW87_15510, partial [Flavobacteriaceae bacterium]|nr:hypothetical protein [Flavobacteriaceae bacterium]
KPGLCNRIPLGKALILADKEHFTQEISAFFHEHPNFDMLVPAPRNKTLMNKLHELDYYTLWPGYAIGESTFKYKSSKLSYRLIVQKESEGTGEERFT